MEQRNTSPSPRAMRRLEKIYHEEIVPAWMREANLSSSLAVPRLKKIVINMGVGEAVADKKHMQAALDDLQRISGQKPVVTKARKSIAGFKIREGYPVGCKVTLRRARMYDFFDRLVSLALPRSRDFRGLSPRAFDGRGNYNLGIREQIIFHEIQYENVDALRGVDIAIETTAASDADARQLLSKLGLPLITT